MDIQILPKRSSSLLSPLIITKVDLPGYILYQKIFILFLTRSNLLFRLSLGSSLLPQLLACTSYNQSLVDNITTIARSQVLDCLSLTLKELLENLLVSVDIESIHIKVTLTEGATYLGAIDVE